MRTISTNEIARGIHLFLKEKPKKYGEVVQFMKRRRLLSKAPEILEKLGKIINQEDGTVVAKVSTAEKINHTTSSHLQNFIKTRYLAKHIVINENLDKKLIGGLKIEVNDEVIDLSIKNRIRKLEVHLTKSH